MPARALAIAALALPLAAAAAPAVAKPPALRPFRIYVVRGDGTHLRRVVDRAEPFQSEPTWSRDGKRLAFVAFDGGDEPESLYRMNADGSHVVQVTDGSVTGLVATSPTWSRSGRLACVLAPFGPLVPSPAPPSALEILPDTPVAAPAVAADWSPDGRSFAYTDGTSLLVVAVDGTGARVVTTGATTAPFTELGRPQWSPDGRRIVFEADDAQGNGHAFVVAAGGGAVSDVTRDARSDLSPVWSPDGKRLAVLRLPQGGPPRIASVAADGTHPRTVLSLPPGVFGGELSWSSRNAIAFSFRG